MNQTINTAEVEQFASQASHWWDEGGPFKPLHQMNPTRISYIKDNILHQRGQADLSGLKMLDIGCGGGLLTEPLARLGADVLGVDAARPAIEVARQHAEYMRLQIKYECCAIENLPECHGKFDVITALEIIEHVDNPDHFIASCLSRLNPGGLIFFSTINKTRKSYLKAILAAEYVLRMIPQGTHDWSKFIAPSKLAAHLRQHGYTLLDSCGLLYNPISGEWRLSSDHSTNYICCAGEV